MCWWIGSAPPAGISTAAAATSDLPCGSFSGWPEIVRSLRTIGVTVVPLAEGRFGDFIALIEALADYEHLARPDADAIARLRADAFGPKPRFEAALAVDEKGQALGYAIWFETYSSFLANLVPGRLFGSQKISALPRITVELEPATADSRGVDIIQNCAATGSSFR